jgi:hypothetical protein
MDDDRLESIIGQLLRAGVLLAAGRRRRAAFSISSSHHADPVRFHTFVAGGQTCARSRESSGRALRQRRASMQFGLLLLILTPVARVAVAVVGFALERDRFYTVVSLIVLLILTCSA